MTKPQHISSESVEPVTFRRWFGAPTDVVFSMWTNPDHMKHWLHPGPERSNPVVEVDLRVGGEYRLGFRHLAAPNVVFVVGRFLAVEHGQTPDLHMGLGSPGPSRRSGDTSDRNIRRGRWSLSKYGITIFRHGIRRPPDPPVPMVIAEAINLMGGIRGRIRPRL